MFYAWVGKIFGRRKWLDRRSLGGYSLWGRKESYMTERLTLFSFSAYDLLTFAGRQTYIHVWALTGSNCVNLSKTHNTLSEPQFHHLYNGDNNNNSPDDE